jgi:dienelactone hydrolase
MEHAVSDTASESTDANANANANANAKTDVATLSGAAVSKRSAAIARGKRDARGGRPRVIVFVVALVVIFLARPLAHHARATSLLMTFSDAKAEPEVAEEILSIEVPASPAGAARTVKARMFSPPGGTPRNRPAVVLVHGVQYLGIEEPRLQRFAKSVVSAGIVVLTPQVDELADYHVSARSIETVGASIRALRARAGGASRVGLMGTSFGGGVSLLTAADPRFADDVAFVVAIGAHDDLARVSGFFANDEIAEVTGATKKLHAHGYGATVLVYTHVEDFFPPADVAAARDALRYWLREKRDDARASAKTLSPESKSKLETLFGADLAPLRPEILAMIARRSADMKTVSPHDRLGGLRAHVYLLHGAGDTVVPATETMWLAKDVPQTVLRDVLVSPAIEHVELKQPSIAEQWALVHFMGEVIGEAESAR